MAFHNDSPYGDRLAPPDPPVRGMVKVSVALYIPGPKGHARERGRRHGAKLEGITEDGRSPNAFSDLAERGEELRALVYGPDCPVAILPLKAGQPSREADLECLELFLDWEEDDGLARGSRTISTDVMVSTAYGPAMAFGDVVAAMGPAPKPVLVIRSINGGETWSVALQQPQGFTRLGFLFDEGLEHVQLADAEQEAKYIASRIGARVVVQPR